MTFFFFFSFKLLQQNVFIYLDVTDYLKFLDFFFSALFSTVCFLSLQWIDWPSVIIIIVMAWSILGLFVLFFFLFWLFNNDLSSVCYEAMFEAHWPACVNIVIPNDGMSNVVKLKMENRVFPKHWSFFFFI